jgi:UPF0755 protein
MIDELDVVFDDRTERGRHRRGARRRAAKRGRPGKKGSAGKTVAALLVALVLLGVLGGGVWYGFDRVRNLFGAPDYDGAGLAQTVTIEVKNGDTVTDIANTLTTTGVVKSAKAFIDAAAKEARSENIQPGFYTMRKQMSAANALTMILDPKNKVTKGLTIPEGLSAIQIFKKLSEFTKIPIAEFQKAAKDPVALGVPAYWFKRDDGKKATMSVEGFLFPDTYEVDPKPTAEKILRMMINRFLTVTGDELGDFPKKVQTGLDISPYEALIVASLAQAEAGNPDDLGKISRVAYNRLYKANIPLQFDVTINYGLEQAGKKTKASKDMTDADLADASNPWNTHVRTGLPPSPINSPGKAALQGAMSPPAGTWLFFVAIDKQGHSAFATTDAEHEANKARARAAGIIN